VTQALQRIHLDLAHPLAGHAQLGRHLLQGRVLVPVQAKAALHHLALLVIELGEPAFELRRQSLVLDLVGEVADVFVGDRVKQREPVLRSTLLVTARDQE